MQPPNFRTLDLNLLRVFDEVMEQRNLTKAAQRLSLTQPAVSNALRRLREALHDDLVVRSGQGVSPTPRALELWPPVRDALSQLQATLVPELFDPARTHATFILAMADATAATLVPGMIDAMETEAPGISIHITPLTSRDPRQLLESGEADMAVGHFPAVLADLTARAQSGGVVAYESRRLYDSRYVCVMRQGHPLANGPLTLDDYCAARHMLVSLSGLPYGFIDEALASLGRKRRVMLTVNQFFTAGRAVANSDLLTVLPLHFVPVTGVADALVQKELPMDVPVVHVDAVWRRQHSQPQAIAWLLHALGQAARQSFAM